MGDSKNRFFYGSPMLTGDNTIPGVKVPEELAVLIPTIKDEVRKFGCDFFDTIVEMLNYDDISEVAAYGGFPVRYPHWRWGMEYEELQRGYEYGQHRIYEMVINSDPCYIYCLNSNTLVDNVTVVAHALFHNDFFKNNLFFSRTHRNMMNKLANHGTRIRQYMSRWGKEKVTEFIDHCLRIDTLIDPSVAWDEKIAKDIILKDTRKYEHPARIPIESGHDYMDTYINRKDWIDKQKESIKRREAAAEIGLFREPTKDIMGYIRDTAPLHPWQQDIISMLHEESLYFVPQRGTQMCNEGWACLIPGSLIPTSEGIIPIEQLVSDRIQTKVFDGEVQQDVSNWFIHPDRKTVKIKTNRGYTLGGSDNHRVIDSDGNWKQLGQFKVGDKVKLSLGSDLWGPIQELPFVEYGFSMMSVCGKCEVGEYKVRKFAEQGSHSRNSSVEERNCIEKYIGQLEDNRNNGIFSENLRKKVSLPRVCDEKFAYFLGMLSGDGHISDIKRTIGVTSGDYIIAERIAAMATELFDTETNTRLDGNRYRISFSSRTVRDLLVKIGLPTGVSARRKHVIDIILRSPKNVVAAFLRGLYDADGYAGERGVILSTSSHKMADEVQILLANFGILSNQEPQQDDMINLTVRGEPAKLFSEQINFDLPRKQEELHSYLNSHQWFKEVPQDDEVVSIEEGFGTVYDFSVENTHKYSAQGFINHNSFGDHHIMARKGFSALGQKTHDAGIFEYASHKMGVLGGKYSMNPYKLGSLLFADIEERWDKGRFGDEYDNCQDRVAKENWDKKLGLGHDKIMEVRKLYNDTMMVNEFFTPEFCEKNEFFFWKQYPNGEMKIECRDPKIIKNRLMRRYINGGLPTIHMTDPNYLGKGYMFLQHAFELDHQPLDDRYCRATLQSLYFLHKNTVYLATRNRDGEELIYVCEGNSDEAVKIISRNELEGIKKKKKKDDDD